MWVDEKNALRAVSFDLQSESIIGNSVVLADIVGYQPSEMKISTPSELESTTDEYLVQSVKGEGRAGFRIVLKPY